MVTAFWYMARLHFLSTYWARCYHGSSNMCQKKTQTCHVLKGSDHVLSTSFKCDDILNYLLFSFWYRMKILSDWTWDVHTKDVISSRQDQWKWNTTSKKLDCSLVLHSAHFDETNFYEQKPNDQSIIIHNIQLMHQHSSPWSFPQDLCSKFPYSVKISNHSCSNASNGLYFRDTNLVFPPGINATSI